MNKVQKFIGELKFYDELIKCDSSEKEINISIFSYYVGDFIEDVRNEINVLLNELLSDTDIKVAMDVSSSNDFSLAFYNVDDKYEKYDLTRDGVRAKSLAWNLNLNEINSSKKDVITVIFNLYKDIMFELFKSTKGVPLTENLSFNYSLLNGSYYFLKGKNTSYVLIERRNNLEENDNNVVYIERSQHLGTVKDEYVYEFGAVKGLARKLINEAKEELGISVSTQVEVSEEVKELLKSC